jgi:hypothetical protein
MSKSILTMWMGIGVDAWKLAIDASSVIELRLAKITMGGAAATAEAELMVSEKMRAAAHLQNAFLTGGLGSTPVVMAKTTLRHYAKKVLANKRRLNGR